MDAGAHGQTWIAGADGCRVGWFVVLHAVDTGAVRRRVVTDVEALLALPEAPAMIGIDAIIGLPDAPERGGRACDRQARRLLGWPRSSSVFSPPAQAALACTSYEDALAVNRAHSPDRVGVSKQVFYLFPKLRTVDRHVTPARQRRMREVHPELAFFAMNNGVPLVPSKHMPEGQRERRELLAAHGFPDVASALQTHAGDGVGRDDILDAHAVCWTAERIRTGIAERLPADDPPRNARGLRMEIWR